VVVLFNDLSTGFLTSVRSQFDGSYRLTLKAPRNYRVYTFTDSTTSPMDLASDFRFPSTAGRAQEVWLTPGMEAAHVDLTLSPDAAVAGRVTAADSTPLPQASVAAVDSATGLFVTSARVDFDGSYRMALPAGNYNIRVEPRGRPLPQQQWFSFDGIPVYSRSAASVVTVATGEEATVNIGVAPGGSISGRLLSLDDGLPVSAAGVALSGQTDATSFEFFGEARVRADGTYTAYGPPGNYRVQAVTSADTPFVREFFNNRPNFWSADLVTITGVDSDTPNIDFVLAPNFDPHGIVVTPDGSRAYVAHRGADSVSVVNLTTRTLAQRIPVGDSPLQMALTPNPHRLFVSNFDGSTISLIDTTTNTTVATILTGPGPDGIVFTSDSARAYVAQNAANDIVVIDTTTNSVVRTIPLGTTSSQIAITPDDQFVYVTTPAIDAVTVISTASNAVVGTIPVGNQPVGIAILPTGGFAYAGNRLESTVSIIDLSTNTVVKTLAVGLLPRRVVSSPDGSVVVTTNEFDHTVSIIETSTNTVVATVPVGRQPWQAAFPPDSRTVFVTNAADNTISVLDPTSRRVIDTIGLGTDRDGDGIADSFERTHGLNPTTAADAVLDPDADGLSNLAEFKAGTNPNNADTDDDGFTDGVEIAAGSHPLNRASTPPFILDQSRLDDPSRRLQ
jgi:YVTN family beta-propeller protein